MVLNNEVLQMCKISACIHVCIEIVGGTGFLVEGTDKQELVLLKSVLWL